MKSFRNRGLAERLEEAVESWQHSHPELKIERRKWRNFFPSLFILFLAPITLFGMTLPDGGRHLLGLVLPVLSFLFFGSLHHIRDHLRFMPQSYHLPISDKTLNQEMKRRWFWELLIGSSFAAVYGFCLGGIGVAWQWAPKAVIIFWSLILLQGLTIYKWVDFIYYIIVRLLIVTIPIFIFVDWARPVLLSFFSNYIPWIRVFEHGVTGNLHLTAMILAGAAAFAFASHFWKSIGSRDWGLFYEGFEEEKNDDFKRDQKILSQDIHDQVRPHFPVGWIEQIIWKWLTPKEKTLSMMGGFCRQKFLTWLSVMGGILGSICLFRLLDLNEVEGILLRLVCFKIILIFLYFGFNRMFMLRTLLISENCCASSLAFFPITLKTLEKRMMKEGALKVPAVAFMSAITVDWIFQGELALYPIYFVFFLFAQIFLHFAFLWHQLSFEWTRKMAAGGWLILLSDLGAWGIYLTMGYLSKSLLFQETGDMEGLLKMIGVMIMLCTPCLILSRLTLRFFLKSQRSDLMSIM